MAEEQPEAAETPEPIASERPTNPTWERVLLARHPKRPQSLEYIRDLITGFQELHGDRSFGDDKSIVGGFGFFEGQPVMLVAQQKGRGTKEKLLRNFGMPKPEGYRKALRLMLMAARFKRPIVTLIDTSGAFPGVEGEERGQAEAIATNLREMSRLPVPIVSFVIGEGGSGGALGIGVSNRVYMLENAYYSVISPESCAAIIYRDSGRAPEAAAALRLTAPDLLSLKVIDDIIAEPSGGAHLNPDAAISGVRHKLQIALKELNVLSAHDLIEQRYRKFREMGNFFAGNV